LFFFVEAPRLLFRMSAFLLSSHPARFRRPSGFSFRLRNRGLRQSLTEHSPDILNDLHEAWVRRIAVPIAQIGRLNRPEADRWSDHIDLRRH
jgi:hypothetical protein